MRVFVDTGAWLALNDRRDQYHHKAVSMSKDLKNRKAKMVTSEYIFVESLTLIRYRVGYQAALLFGSKIMESKIVDFIEVDESIRSEAWEIFQEYKDQDFSLTDCASFVIMQRLNLKKVFAFDEHFSCLGFEIIGRS